jgi:hypothetical protein
VKRCPQGHIYQVFAAGQAYPRIHGKAYNPHTSWHLDGRYHTKGYEREWRREQRMRLDAFKGSACFMATTVDQMASNGLPELQPTQFDGIMELALATIDVTPGRQQLHMDLVAAGVAVPVLGFGETPIVRWLLQDREPWIVITLYQRSQPRTDDALMQPRSTSVQMTLG